MNRSDWIFVGVRLYGLFLLSRALLIGASLLQLLLMSGDIGVMPGFILAGFVGPVLIHSILGAALVFGAPRIERWLEPRNARLPEPNAS